ncbi:hypothetical protein ACU4GD_20885 [Cupriavidus basilensis]
MIANAVMGLLPRPHVEPVAGRILFEGQDLLQLDDAAMRELRGQKIGMVFQEPMTALNPVMRIGDQILLKCSTRTSVWARPEAQAHRGGAGRCRPARSRTGCTTAIRSACRAGNASA